METFKMIIRSKPHPTKIIRSGKEFDADYFGMDKYDPYYFKNFPKFGNYDVIICNYVLNVIKDDDELKKTIRIIQSLLHPYGFAYISVRNNIKRDGYTKKGTYQRNINLNTKIFHKTTFSN